MPGIQGKKKKTELDAVNRWTSTDGTSRESHITQKDCTNEDAGKEVKGGWGQGIGSAIAEANLEKRLKKDLQTENHEGRKCKRGTVLV